MAERYTVNVDVAGSSPAFPVVNKNGNTFLLEELLAVSLDFEQNPPRLLTMRNPVGLFYWRNTQVVEESGLENQEVGKMARGFESYFLRYSSIVKKYIRNEESD